MVVLDTDHASELGMTSVPGLRFENWLDGPRPNEVQHANLSLSAKVRLLASCPLVLRGGALTSATDADLIRLCMEEGRALVTLDLDFGAWTHPAV